MRNLTGACRPQFKPQPIDALHGDHFYEFHPGDGPNGKRRHVFFRA